MDSTKKPIRTNPKSVFTGIAATDLAEDSVYLPVICPELMPNSAYGTVDAGITSGTVTLKDREGKTISSPVTTANHLVATWEGASNQRYPPLVRKGEPVEVYRTSSQDKFYWRPTGEGRDFRTTDRIHFEVGATDPTKPGQEKDDTNTYSAYLDSHNQKVGFKTSAMNGEATALTMEADLKAGTFYVSDNGSDPGNRIFLDTGSASGIPTFQVNLSSGITLKFEGDNAFLKIPGKFEIQAGDRVILDSPLMIFNLTTKGNVIFNTASIAINAAKDMVITAGGVMGINAAATKIAGVLVAAAARIANAVKGDAGASYTPISVQRPDETPVIPAANSPDTSMTGSPYTTN